MKTLLVLYPIEPYINALIRGRELPEIKIKYAQIYQYLISKRYPDFKLIWMMFSEAQSPKKPDMSQLWRGISIKKDDIVGACGISFDEHCKKKLYPDPETIIDACPRPVEKLFIGGFHFWDCVEKVAKCAHEQGIDVSVDDDLTEFFFWKVRDLRGIPSPSRIPLSREKSIENDRREYVRSGGPDQLERVREARRGNPWLVQI
ncbi:MAG: hypothetical protein ABIG29_02770 [Candidatus Nealsonbacteria bacterium]